MDHLNMNDGNHQGVHSCSFYLILCDQKDRFDIIKDNETERGNYFNKNE